MTIGHKVRQIRESKDMKQIELARLCGMERQQLQSLEESDGYPRIQTLIRIAKALGCPLRDLLNGPLHLDLAEPPRTENADYPCMNAKKCPFFQKKG